MAALEIALEIGTSYTSIFLSGNGIVLREPTVIAFLGDPKAKKVRAIGEQAFAMTGKTPDKTTIVSPVVDGFIADADACAILVKEFVKKVLPDTYLFMPRIKAILGVPMGLTVEERKAYEDVCFYAGISEVVMIENVMLSGIGLDLAVETHSAGMVVDIGGGTCEIAVLSLAGVIEGCGVSIGGGMMDKALVDFIVGKYNLRIGPASAAKLKADIGSLFENDIAKQSVNGIDVRTKNPASAVVKATDVGEALRPYYLRIADAAESIINACPPEVAADLYKSGVYFVGGASQIGGLSQLMGTRLKLNAYVVEDSGFACILGAGKLLGNSRLLGEILSQK